MKSMDPRLVNKLKELEPLLRHRPNDVILATACWTFSVMFFVILFKHAIVFVLFPLSISALVIYLLPFLAVQIRRKISPQESKLPTG